ncbi:MerR family transcriptional regulator [Chitiniphilus eburneus]|uniref:MerR family transcriptional regulator n=1 Tax=Chitiniphilus eburneus TaxID=2571148 RepID=A0A4U0PBT5_9NEIS|nr:MerR family transcriptional regulator [Chitiniphilus eburneus]TJZ65177.1 MerR family transcriptional regulator [Chitiniphilus eburneus]
MNETISMTEACRRTGISSYTLRYYESAGLLKNIGRTQGGRRVYREQDLQWLEMLKVLRGTGMSIRKLRQLAAMVERGDASLEARIEFFTAWQAEIERQVALRQQALATLEKKIARHRALLGQCKSKRKEPIPCITKP